jgi:hypothetical protein
MGKMIKKYNLKDNQQEMDDREYWKNQSIEKKIEVLESLRDDAVKLGLYPDYNESKPRLRRVIRVIKQESG